MRRLPVALRDVTGRFAVLGAVNLATTAINFAISLLIARALGAAAFGEVALGLNLLSYGLILMNFGTDMYGVRAFALNPSEGTALARTISLTRLMLSIPVLVTAGLVCLLLPNYREAAATVMLFTAAVAPAALTPLWFAQAREATCVVALATIGNSVLNLLLALAVFLEAGNAPAYAAAKLGADVCLAVGLSIWARQTLGHGHLQTGGFRAIWRLLKDCWPIGASKVVRGLGYSSDLFILGVLASHALLGIYAAPFRIYSLLVTLSSVYAIIVLPRFARAAGVDALRSELGQTMRFAIPAVGTGAAILAALGPMLLPWLFGVGFEAGSGALAVLLLAGVMGLASRTQGQALIGAGRAGLEMKLSLSAMSLAIAAKIILTWRYGIIGTAIGTLLGEAALLVMQAVVIRRLTMTRGFAS